MGFACVRASSRVFRPAATALDGHLALRATWVGMRGGQQYNGVFYCMLIKGKVFDLDVMGPGPRPDDTLKLAIEAIDHLAIARTK